MKQELENKRPDSEERRSIWQRWKQNLKDWVWFCKEHPDWLDLDVQTWVSTHIGQPLRRRWHRLRELRHQNRQRQLPETEWKLGQLLLFLLYRRLVRHTRRRIVQIFQNIFAISHWLCPLSAKS